MKMEKNGRIIILMIILVTLTVVTVHAQDKFPGEMPVYSVTRGGITEDQARDLCDILGVETRQRSLVDENGRLSFMDPEKYQYVPTKFVGAGEADEDGNATVVEAIDIKAARSIRAYPRDKALARFKAALERTGLLPVNATSTGKNTELIVCDYEKESYFRVDIDTTLEFRQYLHDVPLTGPGSKMIAVFDPQGVITNLQYANRELKEAGTVAILSPDDVRKMLMVKYGRDLAIETTLVYFSPALSYVNTRMIFPYYECSITEKSDDGETHYLDELVPAVKNSRYVPVAAIEAFQEGDVIKGKVEIKGGIPPYTIQWNIGGKFKTSGNEVIVYKLDARDKVKEQEISATITDQNGISVLARTTVAVDPSLLTFVDSPVLSFYSYRQFGTENAVTNQFGDLEQGFVNQMKADGVTKRFQWKGFNAWEQDFKSPMDYYYIDNTDITLYVGHGNPKYFKFTDTTHDDNKLYYNDADNDWGDRDLEWLALYSCQVLKIDYAPLSIFDRWKQEFDGLHMLLGFHTNAQANFTFTNAFASNMVDHNWTVRSSWFNAITTDQPSDRVGVVMGAGRIDSEGNWIWNSNDHFWGHGSVGSDITKPNIDFYWAIICW
ncbi:MAG: hypothetical protein JXJ04_14475 [Spirochaetales bacterium]|nr:hypothetical protein [Spirochaetales bacterium]